ncbi:MAG: ion channel [Clostridia bacterium]|nr:ion channel [Clostridia bacterium]
MREKIYYLILKSDKRSINYIYDVFISFIAVLSIIPLMFKQDFQGFYKIERVSVFILGADYILRFIVSDYILGKGKQSFFIYPFTVGALTDLISLLPTGRIFRVFRIFKVLRYMDFFIRMTEVYKRIREVLFTVLFIAVGYIFIAALFMFNAERSSFESFFDALYWATTALTTVGYGDIYPKTFAGKVVSMVTSVLGIAVIALPSGIITANIINEINKGGRKN